jgi:hypothetical protein
MQQSGAGIGRWIRRYICIHAVLDPLDCFRRVGGFERSGPSFKDRVEYRWCVHLGIWDVWNVT